MSSAQPPVCVRWVSPREAPCESGNHCTFWRNFRKSHQPQRSGIAGGLRAETALEFKSKPQSPRAQSAKMKGQPWSPQIPRQGWGARGHEPPGTPAPELPPRLPSPQIWCQELARWGAGGTDL